MNPTSYEGRLHAHAETALAGYLQPTERIEGLMVQAGPTLLFTIWARLLPLARIASRFAIPHLVITNERLLLCEFGRGFPAKDPAEIETAKVTAERARRQGEVIKYVTTARELDEPGRVVKRRAIRIDSEHTFWPGKGWEFDTVTV